MRPNLAKHGIIPTHDPRAVLTATMGTIPPECLAWPSDDRKEFQGALMRLAAEMVPGDDADSLLMLEDTIAIFPIKGADHTDEKTKSETP